MKIYFHRLQKVTESEIGPGYYQFRSLECFSTVVNNANFVQEGILITKEFGAWMLADIEYIDLSRV